MIKSDRGRMDTRPISIQKNMIFNTVGSTIYYLCIWLSSVVIVRISGYNDAGVFSIATTVTSGPATIGLYNVRNYQVSDLYGEYSDQAYVKSRTWTNALSFIACVLLALIYGYGNQPNKMGVILAYMILKMSEAGADVYYGLYQKKARLDYAGISLAIRGIGSLGVFIIALKVVGNLFQSVLMMSTFSCVFLMLYDYPKSKKFIEPEKEGQESSIGTIFKLLHRCTPLVLVAFMMNLCIMLPRIFLEKYYGETVMGYYASVSAPTVIIQLASQTLLAPLIPEMTKKFLKKDGEGVLRLLRKYGVLLGILTAIAVVLSLLFQDWALRLVFGDEIGPYTYLFVWIMISSALISIMTCLYSVLTMMRIIREQLLPALLGVGMALLLSFVLVRRMSMAGVILNMDIAMILQIIMQTVLIARKLKEIR